MVPKSLIMLPKTRIENISKKQKRKGVLKIKTAIIIILVLLWIHTLSKWLVYYASTRGLLYHIATTFGEDKMPDAKKMEEIKGYALKRISQDFTKTKG